jgi:pimeloyl-ACP methyl ester carboxylesterase
MKVAKRSAALSCPDGMEMAVDLFYPEGAGGPWPVTVLCHGFKGFKDWGMFPPLAERLAQGRRSVVTFNFTHNGVEGHSDVFTRLDLFKRQTLTRNVEELGWLLDALERKALFAGVPSSGGDISVVGHSMGGATGLVRAVGDGRIGRLALLNGVSHLDRFGPEARVELERAGEVRVLNSRTGQMLPLGKAWFSEMPRYDLGALARKVSIPTLILQGTDDPTVDPAEAKRLHAWTPGSRLIEVQGANHVFNAAHPFEGWTRELDRVAEELDAFLSSY